MNPAARRVTAWWTAKTAEVSVFCILELGPVALFCVSEASTSSQLSFEVKAIVGQKDWEDRG